MVSLPGDVAPERFHGFYEQIAPQTELMRRQFEDIPPTKFLQYQSGFRVGIPNARQKLRNINGFMHATTNYHTVQDAPHFMRMRYKHVRELNAKRQAAQTALDEAQVHSLRKQNKERMDARNSRSAPMPHKSYAAGLKLKQALRQVLRKGEYVMQRETTRSVRKSRRDRLAGLAGYDVANILRKAHNLPEPEADEEDLDTLRKQDRELQEHMKAVAPSAAGPALETARRELSLLRS
jgi:hypothetical protein